MSSASMSWNSTKDHCFVEEAVDFRGTWCSRPPPPSLRLETSSIFRTSILLFSGPRKRESRGSGLRSCLKFNGAGWKYGKGYTPSVDYGRFSSWNGVRVRLFGIDQPVSYLIREGRGHSRMTAPTYLLAFGLGSWKLVRPGGDL